MMAVNIIISKLCTTVSQVLSEDICGPVDTSLLFSLLERGEHVDRHYGPPDIWLPRKAFLPTEETIIIYPDQEIINEMIAETCQSIPFAMGDVDTFGQSTPGAHPGATGIKAVQGFAVLWPLFNVSKNKYAIAAQKPQAHEVLRQIALRHGVRLGMGLSAEAVPLDRVFSPRISEGSWSAVS
ncbi:hypothetical protein N7532_000828 [Penicillium argentinense]|uniref:Uncharacterized protein n=1 Tax=Penicillium argentinense TaxID=1131581 RepID=A0A9W9KP87_9EURO|nr:uncharacterized protein N7532_000828 [Penicillium argentinense]KAJ5112783.1 hypothetical protein N7532_000828 [Penicillium argentinense]